MGIWFELLEGLKIEDGGGCYIEKNGSLLQVSTVFGVIYL
jgi:hypothetical protein